MARLRLTLVLTLFCGVTGLCVTVQGTSAGQALFCEDWSQYLDSKTPVIKIGEGATASRWTEEFIDNTAWVLQKSDKCDGSATKDTSCQPRQTPAPAIWDAPYMKWMSNSRNEGRGCSVWLPFGKHGLNRIRHDFSRPYPKAGAVDSFIWVKSSGNMRHRGVTLILDTPSGKDAKIAFGMWAGTTSPSYKIEGIRIGQYGYDDGAYHRLPEIALLGEGNPPTCANTWNDFVIDVGRTKPGELILGYRNDQTDPSKLRKMAKPIKLAYGEDYTGIKAIIIGSLPWAVYRGTNAEWDNMVFVGDVSFTAPQ